MGTLALAALVAAAGVFVALPALRTPAPRGRSLETLRDEESHLALIERRDRALAALQELEFDHRTGMVSDVSYHELIAPLRHEAAEALEVLDRAEVGAERALDARTRAGRADHGVSAARDRR